MTYYYIILGVWLLLLLELIRTRLRRLHPDLFAKLGNPTFEDSNLGKTYWDFQKFVWWGYRSVAHDTVLYGLCVVACLSELAVLILFFYLVIM